MPLASTPLIQIDGIWLNWIPEPIGINQGAYCKIHDRARPNVKGRLKPGDTIVEASSGNTGNAMSMVAAVKGYKMLVLMPAGMSP